MATATVVNGKQPTKDDTVMVPSIRRAFIDVTVRGISQLVMHKWDEKAKKQMLDNMSGNRTKKKEAKDPEAEYEATIYYREDGSYGFPSVAFKKAMVRAAKQVDGLAMTDTRSSIFVRPQDDADMDLVLIESDAGPRMREDPVTVGRGGTDLRYRAEFTDWRAHLRIEVNASGLLSPREILNLVNLAGFHVGIGEYRPEKGGDWGRFEVVEDDK